MQERWLLGMVLLRALSASIEVTAVLLMLRMARVEQALRLNAALGLVGPLIFLLVTALGLAGMADKISPLRLALVGAGFLMILWGTR